MAVTSTRRKMAAVAGMFDAHPPASTGGDLDAAAAAMLMQSDARGITLLPALPAGWSHGRVAGLRARGGIAVEMEWREGKLSHALLTSGTSRSLTVRNGGSSVQLALSAGIPLLLDGNLRNRNPR